MKRFICYFLIVGAASSLLSSQSCSKIDDELVNYPNALVTIKTNGSTGQVYFQLDDETTILPTNIKTSPYGSKELRALVNMKIQEGQNGPYSKCAHVNWVDTLLTKKMAPSQGPKDDEVYGKDPIEIVNDWMTVAEDGYLTLRFRTCFGNGAKHILNLVKGDGPYEVVLHHNASGDTRGVARDGIVAFRLNDLPASEDGIVDLTLKWQSFSGMKSARFKYKCRKE